MPSASRRSAAKPAASRPSAARPAAARPDRDLSRPLPASLSWTVLVTFAGALALALAAFDLPWWLAAWYGAASVVAFVVYGADKSAARRSGPRVSERTLLALGLVGGWPGAIVAQQVFCHKTRKRTFRRAFWTTVLLNVVILGLLIAWVAGGPALLGADYSGMLQ